MATLKAIFKYLDIDYAYPTVDADNCEPAVVTKTALSV
ncbi:MAG: hypothetical protein QOI34_221 [Verrucomicrobiota bacterium]|jgi:hypothetical protein